MRGRNAVGGFHRLPKGTYAKLSLQQKQALVRGGEREPPVRCPGCGTQLVASDLIPHVEHRCPGSQEPEPGPNSRWIAWRDAMRMGVSNGLMSYWARTGAVRFKGPIQGRQYLLRDVAMRVARLRLRRKRNTFNR